MTVSNEENVAPNDGNICNEIVNGEQDVLTVTCDYKGRDQPLRGCYVMVR